MGTIIYIPWEWTELQGDIESPGLRVGHECVKPQRIPVICFRGPVHGICVLELRRPIGLNPAVAFGDIWGSEGS